jgi:hypothetical protein
MDADLDLLLTTVFVTADDLLPERPKNARRRLTDAEVVTLCVAQSIMDIPSDRRFLRTAGKHLRHLFPNLVDQSGFHKRRERLADTIEWLCGVFASQSPGSQDNVLLVDSTPVECGRSVETTRRSRLADAADFGYCASHSRMFWGFRLHGLFAPDGTPRAISLCSPKHDERTVALQMLARAHRSGGEIVIGDKGYASKAFAAKATEMDATIIRPARKDEPQDHIHLAPIRQRIESIFWTLKGQLSLERHGARTLHNLRARIAQRLLTLTAAITLNHQLGRPSRSLANYCA